MQDFDLWRLKRAKKNAFNVHEDDSCILLHLNPFCQAFIAKIHSELFKIWVVWLTRYSVGMLVLLPMLGCPENVRESAYIGYHLVV